MKHVAPYLALAVSIGFVLLLPLNSFGGPAAEEGFTSLFNGKDLDGWYLKLRNGDLEMARRVFVAEDGMVHVFKGLPDGSDLGTGVNPTHGMMYTKKSYSRFIFRFEYKWGTKRMNNFDKYQYDAGMYYHVSDDKIWPVGLEYQVRYDHLAGRNHTGDYVASDVYFQWYADKDGTFLLPGEGGRLQSRKSGQHYAKKGAKVHGLDGQWNLCEVIVMGDQYSIHKLNGEIVNLATGLTAKEGIIGLQSETAEVFYRNIMIKELDKDIPIEDFLPR
jgi:hypothetical protein